MRDPAWLRRKFFFISLLAHLPLLSGCLPEVSTYKWPMAVRFVSYHNTNYVSEKLIVAETEYGLGELMTPEGPGTAHFYQTQSFYLETAHKIGFGGYWVGTNKYYRAGIRLAKIKDLPNPKDSGEIDDWNFWPVPETNLWVATDCSSNIMLRDNNENSRDKDVNLKVYLFDPEKVIHRKELTVFVPEHYNDGYPDFRFDPQFQQITYKTHHGYETYSFVDNTIFPCESPPGEPALPIKNRGGGFDAPLLVFYNGRYFLYHERQDD